MIRSRRWSARRPPPHAGYKELKPFVFAGIYPVNPSDYDSLKKALEKLHLTDSAFSFTPETSTALGFGFRAGFLGLLHLDIVKTRIEREFEIPLIATAPNVEYEVISQQGEKYFWTIRPNFRIPALFRKS